MNPFTKHPHSVGETYGQHFRFASGAGVQLILAAGACLAHACFPFLFETTASQMTMRLVERFQQRLLRSAQKVTAATVGQHKNPGHHPR